MADRRGTDRAKHPSGRWTFRTSLNAPGDTSRLVSMRLPALSPTRRSRALSNSAWLTIFSSNGFPSRHASGSSGLDVRLLATAMPGNRLAHAGAKVSFVGGTVPMPHSNKGGGVIACSGSGKTRFVLDVMKQWERNPEIKILGLAAYTADDFRNLCDVFIGLHAPKKEYPNPLSAGGYGRVHDRRDS